MTAGRPVDPVPGHTAHTQPDTAVCAGCCGCGGPDCIQRPEPVHAPVSAPQTPVRHDTRTEDPGAAHEAPGGTDGPAAVNEALVQRVADLVGPTMLFGLQDAELDGPGGTERIRDWITWIAKTVATALAPELARLADYENRITWETTCGEHARLLDACRAADERAEQAETALTAITALAFDSTLRPDVRLSRIRNLIEPALDTPRPAEETP